jgi:hypothetical protein
VEIYEFIIALIIATVEATRIPAAMTGSMSSEIILDLVHAPPIDEGGRKTNEGRNHQNTMSWYRYLYEMTN